jgi:hypothetical protein
MGLFGSSRKKSNGAASESLISQSSEQTKLIANSAAPAVQDGNGRFSATKKLLRRASGSFHDAGIGRRASNSTRKISKLWARHSTNDDNDAAVVVTMEHLPDLILDLETAVETSAQRPSRSLHLLFTLSEHGHNDNRIEMVRHGDGVGIRDDEDHLPRHSGKLVPALLTFLSRCKVNSHEYHLTLLVLNNISIPMENKRVREMLTRGKLSSDMILGVSIDHNKQVPGTMLFVVMLRISIISCSMHADPFC